MILKTARLTFEPLVHATTAGGRAKAAAQLLGSAHASTRVFTNNRDWMYLELLGEPLQVVLVQLHNVFDEVLDGDGVHVICRRKQRTAHLIKPAELCGRKMQRKYFHMTRASLAA